MLLSTWPAGPSYWERRWGSQAAPIIIEAADGPNTAVIDGVNMFDCRWGARLLKRRQQPTHAVRGRQ